MRGYDLFRVYMAVKLHFTTNSYDYFKYNGASNVSPEAFERRKDKHSFNKLAKSLSEEDAVNFFVSNIWKNPSKWTRELNDKEAMTILEEWKKLHANRFDIFKEDVTKLFETYSLEYLFEVRNNEYPELLLSYMRGEISIITIAGLDALTNCISDWDKKFTNDFVYEKNITSIRKVKPFLRLDNLNTRKVLRDIVKKVLPSQ